MTRGRERSVHLYRFGAGGDPGAADWAALTRDERERAGSIRDTARRNRFVVRRARRHAILGCCGAGMFCSAAHSGDLAVVAVAARPVGVDLELETVRRLQERIAARMFAPDERRLLGAFEGAARRRLFHRCWVGKEAYAKGLGRGLAMRFDEFSVAAALSSPAGTGWVGGGWRVSLATHGDRHVAVAAPGDDWEVVEVPLG